MESVGAYEAKIHLPQLLDRPADIHAVIAEIKELRKGQRLGEDLTIRQLIEEGRRF